VRRGAAILIGAVATLAACARPGGETAPARGAPGELWFEEVAAAAGVDFRCESGHGDRYLFPEIILGGCALFDMDGDDDLDLYLVQGGHVDSAAAPGIPNRLYRNDGGFRFADVTDGSGAEDPRYGMGVAAGDTDGDGDTDLHVTNLGRDTLLRNDGGGKFADVTDRAGTGHEGWGTSAAFLDYDADGDLDLWIVHYVNWSPESEMDCYNDSGLQDYCLPTNYGAPAANALFRNEGDGTFTDVSEPAGLRTAFGNGLGIACGDFDGDGRTDVFVANDTMMNHLWRNQGDGTFRDDALLRGCALDEHGKAKAGMGVATADLDDDFDLDVLVVNLSLETDSFFRNDGEFFSDRTAVDGPGAASRPYTRFGAGFADFDNDGALDLYEVNGRVQLSAEPWGEDAYAEPNLLFRGALGGGFEVVDPPGGTREALVHASRGAAFGDIDGDGGVDVVVVNRDGPAYVLRNVVKGRGTWISFRVLEKSGGDALGATVTATVGGRRIRRDVASAYSYCAANDPRVHVGLGSATRVTDVRVRWVDGREEAFGDFEANRTVRLRRGEGKAI
jgi:hypothetical protein